MKRLFECNIVCYTSYTQFTPYFCLVSEAQSLHNYGIATDLLVFGALLILPTENYNILFTARASDSFYINNKTNSFQHHRYCKFWRTTAFIIELHWPLLTSDCKILQQSGQFYVPRLDNRWMDTGTGYGTKCWFMSWEKSRKSHLHVSYKRVSYHRRIRAPSKGIHLILPPPPGTVKSQNLLHAALLKSCLPNEGSA